MKIVLFLIMAMVMSPMTLAQELDENLNLGNEAYFQGRLEEALKFYKKALNSGGSSGELYYNIGNVFYRLGQIGPSLFFYEKAKRLVPRDADLRANIEFVYSRRFEPINELSPVNRLLSKLFFWYSYMTLNEGVIILGFLMAALWISFLAHLLFKRQAAKKMGVTFLILLLLFGPSLLFKYNLEVYKSWGVILKNAVQVRPTFLEEDKTLLTLNAGSKVEIISKQEFTNETDWVQIKLLQGQSGWIPLDEVGEI